MDVIWLSLITAWGVQAASLLSPGPGVLFLLSLASGQGRAHALAGAAGIAGAALVWSTATVLGVSTLLAGANEVLYAMKMIGAAYLVWLAWRSFRAAGQPVADLSVSCKTAKPLSSSVTAGFLMQVSNPKAIFFWLAIASLGATASAPAWVSVLFIVVAVLLSLLIHIAWALLFSASATLSVYGGLKAKIDTVLGVLFLGAALRLVTSKD